MCQWDLLGLLTSSVFFLLLPPYAHIRYRSQVTDGNPQTSAVILLGFRESLCGNSRIVCGESAESSFGICGIVFRTPADSYSHPNNLWETAGCRVREIVFGSLQNCPLKA